MNMHNLTRRVGLKAAMVFILTTVIASGSFAALCVWRKPDQDIKQFFPGAETYKTEYKKPSGAQLKAIEKRIGRSLDADESEFKFYRILKGGKQAGTIMTHLGKGQYGAIEIVVALDNDAKVKGAAIQRDREKKRAQLRSDEFMGQFKGKDKNDPIEVGKDIKPVAGAEKSSDTVAFSVRKLIALYDVLDK